MAFPSTDLPNDNLDPEYGGRPATEFGAPSWVWINAVVRFLAQSFLAYLRVPYRTVVVTVQSSVAAGDVIVLAAGTPGAAGSYYAQRWTAGLTSPVVLGVAVESAAALGRVRVAGGGVIPPSLTGLSAQASAQPAGLSPAGRVRVAQVGDLVLGVIDVQGFLVLAGVEGATAP